MTFTVRAHEEIRTTLLADQRARYQLRGRDLDIARDSDAYAWADAFAFQVEGLEGLALQLSKEIFPDTATTAFLERHAAVVGLSRKAATFATFTVDVTGTGLCSYTTSDVLVSGSGAKFSPTTSSSFTTSGTITVQAQVAGTTGNLGAGTSLTWSPAPSGVTAAAVVNTPGTVAVDLETDAALAQRILAWWRERPGGGNRADWVTWAESVSGVEVAFCYPLLHPSLGAGTPGAVTVCVMQPMPDDVNDFDELLASNSRACAGSVLTAIETALFTTDGGVCPAVIDPDDVDVVTVSEQAQDIDATITAAAGHLFPFAAPLAFTGGTTTTVTIASVPSGLASDVLVAIPDNALRGLYAYRRVTLTGAGPYTLTFAAVGSPSATGSILPLPDTADDIRANVLALIDALGPGDTAGPPAATRYPATSEPLYPATLYRSSLIATLMGVPGVSAAPGITGVTNATITLVGAADPELVTPPAKTIIKCGALRILKA